MSNSIAIRYKKIGMMFKTLREKALLSPDALAQIVGISKSTVLRIEKGETQFMTESLEKYCKPFGIRPEVLLNNDIESIDTAQLLKSVMGFVDKNSMDEDVKRIVKNSQATYKTKPKYLVITLIDTGFLEEFRRPGEIKREIYNLFHVNIPSSTLSNTLKSNKSLEWIYSGIKNYKLYREKKKPK